VRGPKRGTFWSGGTLTLIRDTPPTVSFYIVATEAFLENVPNPTLVRTHAEVIVADDESVSAPDSFGQLYYGLGVVNRNAAAAGVLSIPTPFTDIDWDGWAVHGSLTWGSATSGLIDSPLGVQRRAIDSKAMRKIGSDQVIVFVIEPVAILGTEAFQFFGSIRMLFKK